MTERPQDDGHLSGLDVVALAIVCATILAIVWVVWG